MIGVLGEPPGDLSLAPLGRPVPSRPRCRNHSRAAETFLHVTSTPGEEQREEVRAQQMCVWMSHNKKKYLLPHPPMRPGSHYWPSLHDSVLQNWVSLSSAG